MNALIKLTGMNCVTARNGNKYTQNWYEVWQWNYFTEEIISELYNVREESMSHLLPRNAPSPPHGAGGTRVAAGRRALFGALASGHRGLQHGARALSPAAPRPSSPQFRNLPSRAQLHPPAHAPRAAPPLRRPADVTRGGRHGGRGGRAAAGG